MTSFPENPCLSNLAHFPSFRTGIYGIAIQDDKLLLIEQQRGPHAGKWDLPGGGIEIGEALEEALRREFSEEVAMRFESMQLIDNLTVKTASLHQIGLIYAVQGLSSLDDQKPHMPFQWIDFQELSTLPLAPFVAQILHQEIFSKMFQV